MHNEKIVYEVHYNNRKKFRYKFCIIFAGVIFAVNIKMNQVEQTIVQLTEEDEKVQKIGELQKNI